MSAPKPNDPEYYPRIKFNDRWLIMAPEIVAVDETHAERCTCCAFGPDGMDNCLDHVHDMTKRGANCEGDNERAPCIFVDEPQWGKYIAAQVTERLKG
jgi:hypothetical protein